MKYRVTVTANTAVRCYFQANALKYECAVITLAPLGTASQPRSTTLSSNSRHTEVPCGTLSHLGPPCTTAITAEKTFLLCFLPSLCTSESRVCIPFSRGTRTTLSWDSIGEKNHSFSLVQKQPTLGSLCKMHFYPDLSITTGLFPCMVGYQCVWWGCFILIYWYLNLLSATMVNSTLVPQTLWISWVSCKRLNRDEVEEQ